MLEKVCCHAALAGCRRMKNEKTISSIKNCIQKLAPPVRLALVAGALAAGASGLAWIHPSQAKAETAEITPVALNVNAQPLSRDSRPVTSFAPVVKKVTPSVVKVFVTSKAKNIPSMDVPDEPFFRRFFGNDFGRGVLQ